MKVVEIDGHAYRADQIVEITPVSSEEWDDKNEDYTEWYKEHVKKRSGYMSLIDRLNGEFNSLIDLAMEVNPIKKFGCAAHYDKGEIDALKDRLKEIVESIPDEYGDLSSEYDIDFDVVFSNPNVDNSFVLFSSRKRYFNQLLIPKMITAYKPTFCVIFGCKVGSKMVKLSFDTTAEAEKCRGEIIEKWKESLK